MKNLIKAIQKEKSNAVKKSKKVIVASYIQIGKMIDKELKNKSIETYTENDLRKLQKKINKEMKKQSATIRNIIEDMTSIVVAKTIQENLKYYSKIDKVLSTILKDKYTNINKKVQSDIINGKKYKDKYTLSDRIYIDLKKNQSSIDIIIKQGIKGQEHPLDIAKKLEKYINPNKAKEFEWRKVYPGSKTKIEYNSLRLARTSINHAHHQTVLEMAKKNPFVSHIEWLSANSHGRTCEMCSNRDGKVYPIERVPEDHPNGMCMLLEVIPDDDYIEKAMDTFLESDYDDFDEFMRDYYSDDE